jgi:hypothetical protein
MAVKLAKAMGAVVTILSQSLHKKDDGLKLCADGYYATDDDATFDEFAGRFSLIINTARSPAWRVLNSDVRYRFVIDNSTLQRSGTGHRLRLICRMALPVEIWWEPDRETGGAGGDDGREREADAGAVG